MESVFTCNDQRVSFSIFFDLLIAVFLGMMNTLHYQGLEKETCIKSEQILELFSFKSHMLALDISIMAGIIFLFYAIGFIGLWIRVQRAR